MRIINANICSGGQLYRGEIAIAGERICERNACTDGQILDAQGMYVIPGLVDVHFHGCMGYDICDASLEALEALTRYEGENGVLAICPATMTYPEEILSRIMENVSSYRGEEGAELVGIHLEGPFISPKRIGAQNADYVQTPDADMFRRLQEKAHGMIRICDVAPETEGALDFIRSVRNMTASVSIAHTCSDYETAIAAFQNGANHLTHGFNAMPGLHHRNPGPLAAAYDAKADVELICDGIHIHPAMIRTAFGLFGEAHIILISDSMRACGLQDGQYDLGGQNVEVRGSLAVLANDSAVIAGSVTNLMNCLRYAVREAGIGLPAAVLAATHNPARSIGILKDYGDIEPGRYASLLILNQELEIVHMIRKGKLVR